jgi:hypothetical protein
MTDDPLRRLAKRGRSLLDEDRAADANTSSAATDEAAIKRERQLRWSISSFCRWGWWVGGFAIGAVLAVGLFKVLPASWSSADDGGDLATTLTLLACAIPPLLFYLLRPTIGARAIARERSWLAGLPFQLPGYFDAIGSSTTEGTAALTIQFETAQPATTPDTPFRSPGAVAPESTAPTDDLLRAVFRTIGAQVDGSKITYEVNFGETSVLSNAHLVRWLHQAIDVLLALHAQHPIDNVKIDGFG